MNKKYIIWIALMMLFIFPTVVYANTLNTDPQVIQQQTTEKVKILKQSSTNSVICGVCGGLGEYFDVDPIWFRLGFVLFSCMGGAGVLLYIVTALLMTDA